VPPFEQKQQQCRFVAAFLDEPIANKAMDAVLTNLMHQERLRPGSQVYWMVRLMVAVWMMEPPVAVMLTA
jgi:hypothetical protein